MNSQQAPRNSLTRGLMAWHVSWLQDGRIERKLTISTKTRNTGRHPINWLFFFVKVIIPMRIGVSYWSNSEEILKTWGLISLDRTMNHPPTHYERKDDFAKNSVCSIILTRQTSSKIPIRTTIVSWAYKPL